MKPLLLAPAGSMEALRAAVKGGADAVYLGGARHNARQFAANFDEGELREASALCRAAGVKLFVTVNTLVTDRELNSMRPYIEFLCTLPVDAVIVQDLGLLRRIKSWAPDLPVIASTQAALNSLPAVELGAKLGFTSAVTGRELDAAALAKLAASSPIPIEMFVHGALCFSVSGQCYLSAVLGRRSANRGRCAGPCRLPYAVGGGKSRHMLSLKDNCLAASLGKIEKTGVSALKIEGRMKRPEYVYSTTRLYRALLDEGRRPTKAELECLEGIFSRSGFTSAYFDGAPSRDMFGMRDESPSPRGEALLARETALLAKAELPQRQLPVTFEFALEKDRPARLTAVNGDSRVTVEGEVPQAAISRPTTLEDAAAALGKTGGTGFVCAGVEGRVDEGLMLPRAALNALRREALDKLSALDTQHAAIPCNGQEPAAPVDVPQGETKLFGVFTRLGQVPQNAPLDLVFLPLSELAARPKEVTAAGLALGADLPHVGVPDLAPAIAAGAKAVLIHNLGQLEVAKASGLDVYGGPELNAFNSDTLQTFAGLGLTGATLSFELSFAQQRDLTRPLPCGLVAYGRLPLMTSENCLFKNEYGCSGRCQLPAVLTDRQGEQFVLMRDGDSCRNILCNGHTLYLADRDEWKQNAFALLLFTTESADEAAAVISAYRGGPEAKPADLTRGLYNRGVE
ncbi:MAG TPA: U32 family peptidase [Candidatus Acidoferrum sp.]|nr:U32 family peptidase [Candidatus Acidoferrum sp.]